MDSGPRGGRGRPGSEEGTDPDPVPAGGRRVEPNLVVDVP